MRVQRTMVGILTLGLLVSSADAKPRARKATMADLATGWLGGQPKGIEYARVDLAEDGTGLLVVQYLPQNAPVAYEITGTTLSAGRVEFDVRTLDRPDEPVYLRGRATPVALDLEIGALDRKWKRKLSMEREDTVRGRIDAVSARAKELRKTRPAA